MVEHIELDVKLQVYLVIRIVGHLIAFMLQILERWTEDNWYTINCLVM